MQDIIQLGFSDEEITELFEGVSAGSKVKLTIEVTVSEIDNERFSATIDEVHDDIDILDEEDLEDEEDYEEDEDDGVEEYEEEDEE